MERTVLIIEDEKLIIVSTQMVLEAAGFRVESAMNGEDGIAKARSAVPDLILLDIMMPGIDGYETCRRLRSMDQLRTIKIILVSAKAMLSERLAGYEAGADDYITKPFEDDELLAKVLVFLRLKTAEEVQSLQTGLLRLVGKEIRSPLNRILAGTEALANQEELCESELREWSAVVSHNCQQLIEFVDNAALLGELRSEEMHLRKSYTNLGELMRKAVGRFSDRAANRGVVLSYSTDGTPAVAIDATYLDGALDVLLESAIQRSPKGSAVFMNARSENDRAVLMIVDQSPAVSPGPIPTVFEACSAEDVEHGNAGYGLGLAIAREIIQRHGGTLDAHPCNQGGTAFTMSLPMEPEPETARRPEAHSENAIPR
jgi:DNA-binding response OmpR family regulator